MMTCSRDGVAACGMAGRLQNAGRSHLGGVPSFRSTHRARSAAASAQQQADEGRSEPLTRCTDGGAPGCRGGGMYTMYLLMYRAWDDT